MKNLLFYFLLAHLVVSSSVAIAQADLKVQLPNTGAPDSRMPLDLIIDSMRVINEGDRASDFLFGRFLADPTTFDFRNSGVALGFNNTGSTIFAVPLEKIDADYGNLLLGVTALFPNQLSVNFRLNRTVGLDNFDHTYYSLTLRRDFN